MNDSPYRLVETAVAHPGVDFITWGDKGPFIDTGKTFDRLDSRYMGDPLNPQRGVRIYLALSTVREMAEQAGLFEQTAAAEHEAAVNQAYNKGYDDAVKENIGGHLVELLGALGPLRDWLVSLAGTDGDSPVAEPERVAPPSLDDIRQAFRAELEDALGVTEDELGASGQGDVAPVDQGPHGVPGIAGDVEPTYLI